jgi:dTDP-4-amino-4,6-dideoxygalactose transaminase
VGMINPSPGDEIITGPITDIGTIIPILQQNTIPIFADIAPDTFNLSPESIAANVTEKTKAIIVIHLFGNACDMDPILEVARSHHLPVIEDCSQAHLSEYKGRLVGTMGDIGCFSLQQSKHITTGDGGITITDNEDYGIRGQLFADKGWARADYGPRRYVMLGMNYRMTELQGAVAVAQLRKIEDVVGRKTRNGDLLTSLLADAPGVHPQKVIEGGRHTYWQYGLRVDDEVATAADFAAALRAEGIPAGAGYIGKPIFLCQEALRTQRIYGDSRFPFDHPNARPGIEYREGLCPVTEDVLNHLVTTSVTEFMTEEDIHDIGRAIRKVAVGLSERRQA